MKKKCKPYIKVFIQIFLAVSMSWAFSYIIHQTDNVVSAQEEELIHSCVYSNDERICAEYPSDTCEDNCIGACIKTSINNVPECKLGTCFNPTTGNCVANSPKARCEYEGGEWYETSPTKCIDGCCVVGGNEIEWTTNRACAWIKESSGRDSKFIPERTIQQCYEHVSQIEGACITGTGEERACRFTTEIGCTSARGFHYQGLLCTNPELKERFGINYTKNHEKGCIPGKDEIYWFDSAGNRENIWEGDSQTQKDSSWNNGLAKSKPESCQLQYLLGGITNLNECGNCDRTLGTTISTSCGFDENLKDYTCEDISCNWEGENYNHGERWCYYQGHVLPQEGKWGHNISTSTPGSRHFLMYCERGEVKNYTTGDYRTRICTQGIIELENDKSIKFAVERPNLADMCFTYNTEEDEEKRINLCERNPDCYMRKIDISNSKLNFDICVAKYPRGFDYREEYDPFLSGEVFCELASLECDSVKVRKIRGTRIYWKWYNKGCLGREFTEKLHDLCICLGDCGASVNYVGNYSEASYFISRKNQELSDEYVSSLKKLWESTEDYIPWANMDDFRYSIGTPSLDTTIGEVSNFPKDITENWGEGMLGLATAGVTLYSLWAPFYPAAFAALAAAFTSFLIKAFGLGPGLSRSQIQFLVYGAAAAGAAAGTTLAVSGTLAVAAGTSSALGLGLSLIPFIGLAILALIVVIIAVLAIAGVGKVKEYNTAFQCMPWQPEIGVNECHLCGHDGFGCSKYACQSLGRACFFINNGSVTEKCLEYPNDGKMPGILGPWQETLSEGYEYTTISETGFKVESLEDDGSIPGRSMVNMGIRLDKPASCKFSIGESGLVDTSLDLEEYMNCDDPAQWIPECDDEEGWVEMGAIDPDFDIVGEDQEWYWFGSNRDLHNHSLLFEVPSITRLGGSIDNPDERINLNMRISCVDFHGNGLGVPSYYTINMLVSPERYVTEPVILATEPSGGWIKNDTTISKIDVYVDRPAECKWSLEDKEYNLMENSLACKNHHTERTIIPVGIIGGVNTGFKCSSEVSGIESSNLSVYVRCKDQPVGVPEDKRNIMTKSEKITLKKTLALEIDWVKINNKDMKETTELIFGGSNKIETKIEIKTSKGRENGIANCYYLDEHNHWQIFANTGSATHSYLFDQMSSGSYQMQIMCRDIVENEARYETGIFEIKIDSEPPRIIRMSMEDNRLRLLTDEDAFCYYNFKSCYFDAESNVSMSSTLSKTHSTELKKGVTYYIRCRDVWNNWPSACTRVIRTI